jgi:hypothetical protein
MTLEDCRFEAAKCPREFLIENESGDLKEYRVERDLDSMNYWYEYND